MINEIKIEDKIIGTRIITGCFIGSEAVDWMIEQNLVDNLEDALSIGNILIQSNIICSTNSKLFLNEMMYYQFIIPKCYSMNDYDFEDLNRNQHLNILPGIVS
jgi:hypothetical protein